MREDGTLPGVTYTDVPAVPGPETCELRTVLDRVGDRWSLLVMGTLLPGPRRYSELRRSVAGISQRMLTLTLRGLERDGLVRRAVTPTTPPRVDYALTPAGESLSSEVSTLFRWARHHLAYVTESRRRFDAGDVSPG